MDMGERLKLVDVLWQSTPSKARREEAVTHLSGATMASLQQKLSAACRELDGAIAALEGRDASAADAIRARFDPPYCEPTGKAKLVFDWVYEPKRIGATRIEVSGKKLSLKVGETKVIYLDPKSLHPELARDPEAAVLVPINIGKNKRGAQLSVVRDFGKRLKALQTNADPTVRELAVLADKLATSQADYDLPAIAPLFAGEQILEGTNSANEVLVGREGKTALRAAFPEKLEGKPTVVIALHGATGSEHMFFEAYGRGIAVREATKRGWVFISPRAGLTAIEDSLSWLNKTRGIKAERVFLIGHSMGAGISLQYKGPKPTGLALFAPAARDIAGELDGLPVYMATGKQDAFSPSSKSLSEKLAKGRRFESKVYDPCEHLMVVAEGVPDAYRFFDSIVGDQGS